MGVPLSSYTVLKYLADGLVREKRSLRSFNMDYALDSLDNYSVFAFIIHDPKVHKDFHDYIFKQFKSLHYSTGKHLVFFGLVDSPSKFSLTGINPFYTDVRESIQLYESEEIMNNLSYSAFAISNSLNIDPEMLPAIVVTHDARIKNFRWYKTCTEKLEVQMGRLTGISNMMYENKHNKNLNLEQKQELLYKLLDEYELDLCRGMGTNKLGESMARALSDLMSFFIVENESTCDSAVRNIANIHHQFTLKKLQTILENLQKEIKNISVDEVASHPYFSVIEKLSMKLSIYLSIINKHGSSTKKRFESIENWLEGHSLHLLHTALDVDDYLHDIEAEDFSPSAICIAKIFEKEINYSLVHWIRKQHSINLPEYFNKYQPGITALVRAKFSSGPSANPVDFNLRKNGVWDPPELGKTKIIAKHNITLEDWKSMGISNSNLFISKWDKIHHIRNKAAHPQKVSKHEMEEMKLSFISLEENSIFEKLANLKSIYRSSIPK